jgi:putative phosphoesterase
MGSKASEACNEKVSSGMMRIGLLSDTHNYLDDAVFRHFDKCDEIWHAGDFGTAEIADKLKAFKPLRGVFGNIDGYDIRSEYPEKLRFTCEEVNVLMIHIGGYPGRYVAAVKQELQTTPTQLFISGHSHILKIIYDDTFHCLHMNPGAAGTHGWHKVRTLIRFEVDGKLMKNCEVIELGKR